MFSDTADFNAANTPLSDDGRTIPELTGEVRVEGCFDELDFVGRGGLGIVFRAHDNDLHRDVAIKFMQAREANDPDQRKRFAVEAEITSRLDHPGVVPVYAMGTTVRGRPFYVMRYVRGSDLDSAITDFHAALSRTGPIPSRSHSGSRSDTQGGVNANEPERLPDSTRQARNRRLRELLGHFVSVCKTIAYAHRRGVVHGDLKPHNVMLGRYGETMVVDWGQAIIVERTPDVMGSGELTELRPRTTEEDTSPSNRISPAYMSPEQARGERPSATSDIYSLGATLFKLLVGRPAVSGSLTEVRDRVLRGDLPRPRALSPWVPRALDAICMKAMSLNAEDRYPSALALANDIERYLADDPVTCYREPGRERLMRWMRRHRAVMFTTLISTLLIVIVSLLSAVGLGVAARSESIARSDAERASGLAERHRRRNLALSAIFLSEAIANEIDLRWRILEAEASSPRLRELVATLNENPTDSAARERLQGWLNGRALDHKEIQWKSWFVNSRDGTQQARSPLEEAVTIGQNFRHRDYFHGRGRDLTSEELGDEPPPILEGRPVHMSAVFFSRNTQTAMVAFSVPIWSDPPETLGRTPIGLLCMTIEVGQFEFPNEVQLLLVDSRENQFDGEPGLVLFATGNDLAQQQELPPRVDEETLDRAAQLRRARAGSARMSSPIACRSCGASRIRSARIPASRCARHGAGASREHFQHRLDRRRRGHVVGRSGGPARIQRVSRAAVNVNTPRGDTSTDELSCKNR
ncbi:MAG: protein kinase [Pirellulaceae bacterium]